MSKLDPKSILAAFGLEAENPGTYAAKSGWLEDKNGRFLESYNPATGELLGKVRVTTEAEYETVIREAKELFREWRKIPAPQRGEAVRLMGEALRERKDELGSLVSLEMGKIKQEGDGEVQEMIDIADFAVGQSRMLYGMTTHSERPDHRLFEQWHPLGLVGVITAFNFPVAVWSWNTFISAVCGNTNVWKGSPKTPLISVAVQKLCNEVLEKNGFPAIFSLFTDDTNELAKRFVEDERVNLLSFTGSSEVAKKVAPTVAGRLGRYLIEAGGNNAIIVDETANLDMAIPAIAFGAVGTAGQRCTSTRRVIAHESIVGELTKKLVGAYKTVRIGNPLDADTLMGPLADETAVKNYEAAIETIKGEKDAEILCGGKRIDGDGHFVEPTIVKARNDMAIVQAETFAPILYIMSYKTLDEAIEMQNDVPQGLSSAIFTDKLQNAERYLSCEGSDCGISNVNIGTSGAEIGGAFGGEKDTGGGRESGSDAWKQYMRRQTNTVNYGSDLPLAQGIKFDLG
ncbi:aldehyde dehydrogenase family protein [Natronospira sp.]|uniref:L-piperidine-6-carboxylate dehydrogenase n=1 Tax=Natronospira sp. TaxID=2024970 RepID=UPI0038733D19